MTKYVIGTAIAVLAVGAVVCSCCPLCGGC